MNKKRAKFNFCFVVVLLAISIALCFASFKLPGMSNDFVGLFNSISATNDITEGYYSEYEIKTDDISNDDVSNVLSKMND